MDRKEFIAKLGVGAAFILSTPCIIGCSKDTAGDTEDLDIDFTVDLNEFDSLRSPGSFIITNNIVVANNIDGQYIAATVKCSHEGLNQIKYDKFADIWECTAHGARFSQAGSGLNANGSGGLTTYNVTQDGDTLRVFS